MTRLLLLACLLIGLAHSVFAQTSVFIPEVGKDSVFESFDGSTWSGVNVSFPADVFRRDVYFVNGSTGWMVGHDGLIAKTTDGGANWNPQTSRTYEYLTSVAFADSVVGLVVGFNGKIMKTTDGGTTWQAICAGVTTHLQRVYFTKGGLAFVGGYGGTLLKSADSGSTWAAYSLPTNHVVQDFSFVDENAGWLAGWYTSAGHIVMKTTDGGATWTYQHPSTNDLHGVAFRNADTGFVTGWGGLFATYNGGSNWLHVAGTSSLFNVRFANDQIGFAVGNGGIVWKTTDGGVTWANQTVGTTGDFYHVAAVAVKSLIFAEDFETGTFDISKWTQHGAGAHIANYGHQGSHCAYFGSASWGDIKSNTSFTFTNIRPRLEFWAKTDGTGNANDLGMSLEGPAGTAQTYLGIYIRPEGSWRKIECFAGSQYDTVPYPISEDNTWHHYVLDVNSDATASFYMDSVLFWHSAAVNWGNLTSWQVRLSGYNNATNKPVIDDVALYDLNGSGSAAEVAVFIPEVGKDSVFESFDGSTWSGVNVSFPADVFRRDVYFVNGSTGWMVGHDGLIAKTTDGGANWNPQTSRTYEYLTSVAFADSVVGLVVGANGKIMKTTDGGTTWQAICAGVTTHLQRVYFTKGGLAFVGGYGGTLLKSNDSGSTWTAYSLPTNHVIQDFSFVDENTGWLAGWYTSAGHIVMKTTDGGTTWAYQHPSTNDLHGVAFRNADTGFVTGWGGLFATYSGGSNWSRVAGTSSLFNVRFANDQIGFAVGNGGVVWKTTDGGVTWANQTVGTLGDFYHFAVRPNFGFLCAVSSINGRTGNVDCSPDKGVDISDLTALIDYLYISFTPLCNPVSANTDGDVGQGIDISDLSTLIDFLYISFTPPALCNGNLASVPALELRDEGIVLGSKFENGVTTISLNSPIDVRGIELELKGDGDAAPSPVFKSELNMFSGRHYGLLKIGIIDKDGPEVIASGLSDIVKIDGDYTLVSATVVGADRISRTPSLGVTAAGSIPKEFSLSQNYPNPFNPATTISFSLPVAGHVTVRVYNAIGQEVATLVDEERPAGAHQVLWDANKFASGVYLYRLTTDGFTETKKMLLIK